MATATLPLTHRTPTLASLLNGLDPSFPPDRILAHPLPGTATADDVVAIRDREGRLCELVDGTLVEKTRGAVESRLAARLIQWLLNFMDIGDLGEAMAPDGMISFGPNQVRLPDISVYLRDRLAEGKMPGDAVLKIVPDLAVEILSPGNTKKEMEEKRLLYFAAGVRLVWYADPKKRQIWVYDAVDHGVCLDHAATLDGGAVLPEFTMRVGDWLK